MLQLFTSDRAGFGSDAVTPNMLVKRQKRMFLELNEEHIVLSEKFVKIKQCSMSVVA